MELQLYIVLWILAVAASYVALRRRIDPRLGAVASLPLWIVLIPSSLNVTQKKGVCCVYTESYSSLAFLALGGFALMALFLFGAATGRIDNASRIVPDRSESDSNNPFKNRGDD
jgi:peptidoglycan/LPS O-acetylase OafA/YrhL